MRQEEDSLVCKECSRSPEYCVCEYVTPIKARIKLVVLQHPQEPGMDIGTVAMLARMLPNVVVKIGLSWPNLRKILGQEVEYKRWGVLYLGSTRVETLPKGSPLVAVTKKGELLENQKEILSKLQGLVLLDGTWSQAKTLWWRNAWLLKLQRLVLNPEKRSMYDQIRKEPRRGCLSTVESAVEALSILESDSKFKEAVQLPLSKLIEKTKNSRVSL